MTQLGELYTDFFRIDLDAPGGYARVADAVAHQEDGTTVHRAFKLMRHELDGKQVGLQRFGNELKILVEITKDKEAPPAITRIYDSGFVETQLSKDLHKLHHKNEKLDPSSSMEIVSTGLDIQKFLDVKSALMEEEPDRWLPYLVVDLAPYNDSLSRQIIAQPEGNVNLYDLPVNTVVDMALQLLDVMDYMHNKLRYAYMDWKPEHIYWNESSRLLKLIDWNVTIRLNGDSREKQTIREDVRMFCGAALYCSLALTDPEELISGIGPAPIMPKDKAPTITPRYWTSKPNFYQRDKVLDEKIKQLVQTGLDPNQGFNSPQELKNALIEYVEQSHKQSNGVNYLQSDEQSESDLLLKLPDGALQQYRRARSYIAAEDYLYAALALEVATETARAAGMIYRDAEELLPSVQDILQRDEIRKKVNPLLEKEQWKKALDIYAIAIEDHPKNELLKKEFDGLQGLVRAESELHNKGVLRLFTNSFRLKNILDSTKDIVNPSNPLYSFVKQQYNQIRLIQMSGLFLLLAVVLFASVLIGKPKFYQLVPTTTTPASTISFVPSMTPVQITTALKFTVTFTITPTLIPTDTLEPTATPLVAIAYGKLAASYFIPYDEPNQLALDVTLMRNQPLVILSVEDDHGAKWYECTWEINGVPGHGWILAKNIRIVHSLTPTP